MELLAAAEGNAITAPREFGAECPQSLFAVVAGAERLFHGCFTLRQQPGKQYRGLYLGTGHWQPVINRMQARSVYLQRWTFARPRVDLRAHLLQRRNYTRHGAA